MSANKEAVISEKELSCKFGQEVLVGYSEAMHPSSYSTFDAFVAAVQKEWDAQWSRVYSADWSSKLPCPLPYHAHVSSMQGGGSSFGILVLNATHSTRWSDANCLGPM